MHSAIIRQRSSRYDGKDIITHIGYCAIRRTGDPNFVMYPASLGIGNKPVIRTVPVSAARSGTRNCSVHGSAIRIHKLKPHIIARIAGIRPPDHIVGVSPPCLSAIRHSHRDGRHPVIVKTALLISLIAALDVLVTRIVYSCPVSGLRESPSYTNRFHLSLWMRM